MSMRHNLPLDPLLLLAACLDPDALIATSETAHKPDPPVAHLWQAEIVTAQHGAEDAADEQWRFSYFNIRMSTRIIGQPGQSIGCVPGFHFTPSIGRLGAFRR